MVSQSREGFFRFDWDSAPVEEIVPVKIGELEGELIQGAQVVFPDEGEASWNPDMPIMRLRWREGDPYFQITQHGNEEAFDYLDQWCLIQAWASEQMVAEEERILEIMIPNEMPAFWHLVNRCLPVVPDPQPEDVSPHERVIDTKDLPILAAVVREKCPLGGDLQQP